MLADERALTRAFLKGYKLSIQHMVTKTYDSIRPWFEAAEELGEYIGIRFGRLPPGATEPEWIFLRHTDVDGIGGFAEILRRRGAEIGPLPQIKHPAPPSWAPLLRLIPRFARPRQRLEWTALRKGPDTNNTLEPPAAVACHVLSECTTTQIKRVCRKTGVTVNSFLLKHLTKAIRPFLKDQSATIPWMIPVNLRGKFSGVRDTDNHSSYIAIKVQSYETVTDVHRKIYSALGRGEHWANWHAYKGGRFLSNNVRKYLLATEKCMPQWNLGGFSNLGEWDSHKKITHADCEGAWLFCPPVLRCQWVGAGCVTYQGRLGLTIQVHPEVTKDSAIPKAWLQNWIEEVEMDVFSVLSDAAVLPVLAA